MHGLLSRDLSAVECYGKTIEKIARSFARPELLQIHTEHKKPVNRLTSSIRNMGGAHDTDSWRRALLGSSVRGTAKLLGSGSAANESLSTEEELGRLGYETALEDEGVINSCKAMIRTELMPRTKDHRCALARLERSSS